MMKKETKIWIFLVVMIISTIIAIYVIKNYSKQKLDEETMKCIASKTNMLYTSKICSHCKNQKDTLGDYISLFNQTDCFYVGEKCAKENIEAYPTWVIENKVYVGEKSIEQLKQITGCGCITNSTNLNNNASCNIGDSCITEELKCK